MRLALLLAITAAAVSTGSTSSEETVSVQRPPPRFPPRWPEDEGSFAFRPGMKLAPRQLEPNDLAAVNAAKEERSRKAERRAESIARARGQHV